MTKITRATQPIFGSNAAGTDVGQFGSKSAGSPVNTKDPATIMALSQFLTGWRAATPGNVPYIQDMTGLFLAITSQLAYLLQEGVPEYDSATTYFTNSIVKKSGSTDLYKSLVDTNIGNALTDSSKWQIMTIITSGTGPPSSIPAFIGQEYIDTTGKRFYKAKGISSSSDWYKQPVFYYNTITIPAGGPNPVITLPWEWTNGYIQVLVSQNANQYVQLSSYFAQILFASYDALTNATYTSQQILNGFTHSGGPDYGGFSIDDISSSINPGKPIYATSNTVTLKATDTLSYAHVMIWA